MFFLNVFVLMYLILGLHSALGCFYVQVFCFFYLITSCYNYCDWKLSDILDASRMHFWLHYLASYRQCYNEFIWLATFKHNLLSKNEKRPVFENTSCVHVQLFVYSKIPNCLWYMPCSFSDIVQLYLLLVIFCFTTKLNWLLYKNGK